MALGGGNFITQNKVLPGAYMNFVSAARASAELSDRGVVSIPLEADWMPLGEVVPVTAAEFAKDSLKLFGYDYTAPQLTGLRELFRNARLAYLYRLGSGGAKAANDYAEAKYPGKRGDDLTVVVAANVEDPALKDVTLLLGGAVVDRQTVADAKGLADDAFVTWKDDGDLDPTAGAPLTGGTAPTVLNGSYQDYLDAIESYTFNALGCPSGNAQVKGLFAAFTKRMRDDMGVKFQCVAYDQAADHEGVYDVMNKVEGDGPEYGLVYWVTGVAAGTAVNKSALNKVYDGEYKVDVAHTQAQLEAAIKAGRFALHRVGGTDVRVLADINSLTTVTPEKGGDFKENQTIRVIDQIANDIAVLFNGKYIGAVPNDADGRISLWADIVKHHEALQQIRAIEGFSGDDVKVEAGATKRSVVVTDLITVVNAMAQLYMTVTVA